MGFVALLFLLLSSTVPYSDAAEMIRDRHGAALESPQEVPISLVGEELSADSVHGLSRSSLLVRSEVFRAVRDAEPEAFFPLIQHTTVEERGPPPL